MIRTHGYEFIRVYIKPELLTPFCCVVEAVPVAALTDTF